MENNKTLETCKNRVFINNLAFGKNNPIALKTNSNHIYRVTGIHQIYDIIECNYIRPKNEKLKGGHHNEVFWTLGGESQYYYDKRPVLEIPTSILHDNDIGAKKLDDLSAIWIFDEPSQMYINKLELIKKCRKIVEFDKDSLSIEELQILLTYNESKEQKKTR